MRPGVLASLLVAAAACGIDATGRLVGTGAPGGAGAADGTDGTLTDPARDDAGDAAAAPDAPTGSGFSKSIAFDPGKVAGALADFPVWIDLADADLAAHAKPDGSDVSFAAADGTPLPYEIQRWDATTGSLSAWVRVPALTASPATSIELVYGTDAPGPAPASVFSSSFAAVWHLEDALASGAIAEATGTRPGTATGLSPASHVTARLGAGVDFDGGAAEIAFDNPLLGGGPHTISLWVSQRPTGDNDALVVLGNAACGESRWLHGRFDDDTAAVGFYCNDWSDPDVELVSAGFTLVHWVYEGGVSRIYRDGALAAGPFTQSGSTIDTKGTGGHIGNAPGGWGANMGLHGIVDEVRIATVARSAAWIATEYANQSSPSTFYAVGPEKPR